MQLPFVRLCGKNVTKATNKVLSITFLSLF